MSDQRIPISQLSETQTAPDASYIAIDDGSLTKKITVENFNSTSTASAQSYANQAAASAQTVEDNIATSAAQIREATLAAREATQASTAATASATSAYDSASLAQNYSANASTSAGQAMNAADSSAQNLTASKGYAEDSEAWAVGKRNGSDVPSSDDTYHNNAKYYSDNASTAATSAASDADRAEAAAESINVPDTTLTISGVAADSKATGDRIAELRNELDGGVVYNYTDGYGLDSAGNVVEATGKSVSEEISISDIFEGSNRFYGGNIATQGDYYVAFYDSNYDFISALQLYSTSSEYRTINWTTQVTGGTPAYFRFSFQTGYSAKITNNANTGQIVYWSAESTASEGLIAEVDGLQNEVDRMRENMPEEGQIDAIETAINGKSEQNYIEGYGLNADGTLYQNSNQSVSDKVPYTWTGSTRFTYGENSADYRICFYDENDTVLLTYISSANSPHRNVSADSLETTPSYVRFSFKKDFIGTLSENSNEESRITYYTAEETVTQGLVEKVSDIQTTMLTDYGLNVSASADTLTDGTTLEVAENIDNRKNDVIEFHAEIDSFTSLAVGHGYMINHGSWIVIDSTNVTVYADDSATQTAQYQHGLTFAHYINVLIKRGNEGKATIEITTGGSDLVYTQDNVTFFGSRGSVFAFCTGTLNNVKLSAVFKDFNEPIIIFGDSYQSVGSTARWPYYMIANGYTHYLMSGFPGANAGHEREAFRAITELIKPKYIVWCLGMNGSDSAEAVNATWKASVDEVIAYCERNNVTPILATIPNVPDRIQTFKNAYVKSLGYRYIDFAKAVGAESQGSTWYTGMLSNDNLHPSSLGAKALYAQVLADLPEIIR